LAEVKFITAAVVISYFTMVTAVRWVVGLNRRIALIQAVISCISFVELLNMS